MVDNSPDLATDLTNVSSMSEQIESEAFEKDFNVFIKYLTPEDLTKIYKCIDILLDESTNSGSESPPSDTLALPMPKQPEDVEMRSVTQNASNFTWPTTNTSTSYLQNDVPLTNDQRSPTALTELQILEEVFSSSQYIVGKKRRALAELLGLTEKQVSLWFDHRRRRRKLQQLETNENTKFVPATEVCRQSKHVGARSAVQEESFDTDCAGSSNLSPEEDFSGEDI